MPTLACIQTLKKRQSFLLGRQGSVFFGHNMIVQKIQSQKHNIAQQCKNIGHTTRYQIGYTASKKVGNAVARNFAKRRMRSLCHELLTQNIHNKTPNTVECLKALLHYSQHPSHGIIIIAKPSLIKIPYNTLKKELEKSLHYLFLNKRTSNIKHSQKKYNHGSRKHS